MALQFMLLNNLPKRNKVDRPDGSSKIASLKGRNFKKINKIRKIQIGKGKMASV